MATAPRPGPWNLFVSSKNPYFLVVFLVAVFFVAAAFFTPGFS